MNYWERGYCCPLAVSINTGKDAKHRVTPRAGGTHTIHRFQRPQPDNRTIRMIKPGNYYRRDDTNCNESTEHNAPVLNIVSSPGAGKTTLIVETLKYFNHHSPCAVICGNSQTSQDLARLFSTGALINTVHPANGCYLTSQMVQEAMSRMSLEPHRMLFIDNRNNLLCPPEIGVGESHKIALLSVTEGEDKPLKFRDFFASCSLMLLNKIDLLPFLKFDVGKCLSNARQVNPAIQILLISAATGEGMLEWFSWLKAQQRR